MDWRYGDLYDCNAPTTVKAVMSVHLGMKLPGQQLGTLSADEYNFHDLSLGDHTGNAYHNMSLNERRLYYEVIW